MKEKFNFKIKKEIDLINLGALLIAILSLSISSLSIFLNYKQVKSQAEADVFFSAQPEINNVYQINNSYYYSFDKFKNNPKIDLIITNRGVKPINILSIHAEGNCLNLKENQTISLTEFSKDSIKFGDQKIISSETLKNFLKGSPEEKCSINFKLRTTYGEYSYSFFLKETKINYDLEDSAN